MWASTRDAHGCGDPLEMCMGASIHQRYEWMWASTGDARGCGDSLEMCKDVGMY